MQRFLIHPATRLLLLFSALAAMIFVLDGATDIKKRIGNTVFEFYMKAKPREASGKLVFVDIDDESLALHGQWPWPRTILAEMIDNISAAGAKVIIFDGVISESDRHSPVNIARLLDSNHPAQSTLKNMPDTDLILANSIEKSEKFVAGFTGGLNDKSPRLIRSIKARADVKEHFFNLKGKGSVEFLKSVQFLPDLQRVSAGNGSFIATQEDDGIIRKTGLVFHNQKNLYPSLIFEGLRVSNEGKDYIIIDRNEAYNKSFLAQPFSVQIGQYEIPLASDGKMWVYFREFLPEEKIAAHKFTGDALPPNLKDKFVFIGSSAEGLSDLRATPLGFVAGVKVHMNAFEQIIQNKFLMRNEFAHGFENNLAVIASLLIIILSFWLNPVALLTIFILMSAGGFWASWELFETRGALFDPVTPTVIAGLMFVVASILSFLKTEYERRQVKDAFGLYISPDFMKELTSDPDKLKLGGEIRDLSVMFTDIRNFTSISEGLTPEELIQLMNDFLTPMSDLVMQNRGTIDKYMGDAMMAFWNAPLDDKEHARNACITALGMQAALHPINEAITAKAKENGKEPVLLQAGIGINTGPCAVGNMGSKQRFAYSTLGDAVNLASRLEGQTKNYGVDILIGESTYEAVRDFACLEMDLIQVKGKQEAVRIFALLGSEEIESEKSFRSLKEKHKSMIVKYRDGDFEDAKKEAQACKKLGLYNLDIAYDLYIERCDKMIKNPPKDWDGVFVATSK